MGYKLVDKKNYVIKTTFESEPLLLVSEGPMFVNGCWRLKTRLDMQCLFVLLFNKLLNINSVRIKHTKKKQFQIRHLSHSQLGKIFRTSEINNFIY